MVAVLSVPALFSLLFLLQISLYLTPGLCDNSYQKSKLKPCLNRKQQTGRKTDGTRFFFRVFYTSLLSWFSSCGCDKKQIRRERLYFGSYTLRDKSSMRVEKTIARECMTAGAGRGLIVFHPDRKWRKRTGSGARL